MKKTLIATLSIFFSILLCFQLSAANAIPKGESGSAGYFIVVSAATDYSGDADGSSQFHFIRTYVGDTFLRYNANSSASDVNSYNQTMISSIITCKDDSAVSLELEMSDYRYGTYGYTLNTGVMTGNSDNTYGQEYQHSEYCFHYLLVAVKVSGFDNNHNNSSDQISDWLGDSGCTYTVVSILDSRDNVHRSQVLELVPGECLHLVVVPFSYMNTTYFEGSNISTGTHLYSAFYVAFFQYRYKDNNDNVVYGTSSDRISSNFKITKNIEEYTELSFGWAPISANLSISELVSNKDTNSAKATTVGMSYAKMTNEAGAYANEGTWGSLSLKLYPYNNTEEYYFINSNTSQATTNRYFTGHLRVENISSSNPNVKVKADGVEYALISDSSIDTSDYSSPGLEFIVTKKRKTDFSSYPSFVDGVEADLSFELYPYIDTVPTVVAGDYTMYIVGEFSIID